MYNKNWGYNFTQKMGHTLGDFRTKVGNIFTKKNHLVALAGVQPSPTATTSAASFSSSAYLFHLVFAQSSVGSDRPRG
jgi:hypothetical protein